MAKACEVVGNIPLCESRPGRAYGVALDSDSTMARRGGFRSRDAKAAQDGYDAES